MALDDERRADLEDAVTDMRILDEMVKTNGWQKFILPYLTGKRRDAINKLLVKAENMNELYKARAAVEVIDDMISDPSRKIVGHMDRRMKEGKDAVKILSKEKPEEDEEKDNV